MEGGTVKGEEGAVEGEVEGVSMGLENVIKAMGICLMLFALVTNPFIIGQLFAADKTIHSIAIILRIIIFELVVFSFGLIVFIYSKKIIKIKKNELFFLILVLSLCFVVLEAGTRVYLCNFASSGVQSKYLLYGECGITPIYSPHHYLNYYGSPNYKSKDGLNMHNSLGFRGDEIAIPKLEGTYRIVILGGSTAYTIGVKDWRKDWARQLQKELRESYNYDKIEVINGALGGWNSWESLINLEFRVLDIEPDMIIIYHGTNDVHTRLTNQEFYKGDNSGRRKQWVEPKFPIFLHSAVIRIITGINPEGGIGAFIDAETTAGLTKDPSFNKKLNMTPMEAIKKNPPIYFERNLRNMIALSKEYNISVLLSTWAHSNQLDDYAASPHYEVGFKENNEVVKKVAKLHNVPCYDFESEMPKDKRYWSDGRHVNEEGAKIKGELFAKFIYENRLIGSSFEHTI